MSHLPPATAANFCLRLFISRAFGHKLACVSPSFDKSNPRVDGPSSSPVIHQRNSVYNFKEKSVAPLRLFFPHRRYFPASSDPVCDEADRLIIAVNGWKKLYWLACVCFSFLSGAAIPTFTNPAWQGSSSGDVSRHNTTQRARAYAYVHERNKWKYIVFLKNGTKKFRKS